MSTFNGLLDLCDYLQDHILQDETNKKVALTKTEELNEKILNELVCLGSKLYSIEYLAGTNQSSKDVNSNH